MIVVKWLKWFFVPSGIVVAEEKGRLSWLQAVGRLFSGGVKRDMYGPSAQDFLKWLAVKHPLRRYKCKQCGVHFWSWKKRDVCYKFTCYRRAK